MIKLIVEANDVLKEWFTLLLSRFKKSFNIALDAMIKKRYTLRDATNRRELKEYAQKILRFAKNASLNSLQN